MYKQLKMAVVGLGTWGENHIRLYLEDFRVTVAAVCDMNPEKAKKVAEKYGIKSYFTDYEKMLEETDIDAVAIVTPDFAHKDVAIAAAKRGKHLLIEKPLATTEEDVRQMIKSIEENHVRAMVDLHNRFSPPFQAAWQSILNGNLGEPYSGYFRLNDIKWVATDLLPWAQKSSILWFLGSHSLDTLRWLFEDDVTRVYSVSRSGILKNLGIDTVDEYLTTLEFSKGAIVQMENGWITPNGNSCVNDIKCNIMGTKGMIEIDASSHHLIHEYTDHSSYTPDIIVQNHVFGKPKGFAFESIRTFIDCLITEKDFPVSIYDAANTTLTILAIMKSAESRQPVEVSQLYPIDWKKTVF